MTRNIVHSKIVDNKLVIEKQKEIIIMKKRKLLSLVVAVAMLATCFAAVPAMAKSKKVKSGPALVKSVITKYYDEDTKKWENSNKTVYTYKKGYPSLIKKMYYRGTDTSEEIYKYKIKGKKAKSMKQINNLKVKLGTAKYKKGYRYQFTSKSYDKSSSSVGKYKWKNGFVKEYVSNNKSTYKYSNKPRTYIDNHKYTYKIEFKKGLPKKIEGSYVSQEGYKGETLNKYESSTKYITTLGKAGIVKQTEYLYEGSEKAYPNAKYVVKMKKGRVTKVTAYDRDTDDNGKEVWEPEYTYIFKYANKKISKQRYSNMINSIITDSSRYGTFIWF